MTRMLFSVLTPSGELIHHEGRVIVGTLADLEHTGIAQIPRLSPEGWLTVHVPPAQLAALDPPPLPAREWVATAACGMGDGSPEGSG